MAADPTTSRTVDDLLLEDTGFDSEDDDPFADTRPLQRDDKPTLSPRKRKAADDEDPFGKAIDEEVKITKQRKKIPKLDAERLLSEPGIPKIRTLLRSPAQFQKKLRLKGKGYEFKDAARLLNYYQMWLDNLYPRAKFVDAVQLVEKAGHTKKMQMYRKSWIDEGKPGHVRREEVDEAVDDQDANVAEDSTSRAQGKQDSTASDPADEDPSLLFFASEDHEAPAGPDGPDDDELDALMAQGTDNIAVPRARPVLNHDSDSEGEDDLDALLAQESSSRATVPMRSRPQATKSQETKAPSQQAEDVQDDDDDLDALMNENTQKPAQPDETINDFEEDDMDDLDALLSSHKPVAEPELPAVCSESREEPGHDDTNGTNSEDVPELVNTVSSSPIPNIELDELDDLLNEHDANVRQKADTGIVEEFIASSPIAGQDSQ